MSTHAAPAPKASRVPAAAGLRPLVAVALAVALLVVLPLVFTLLAPPQLASGSGPSLSAASRDLSTAALDRLERLLSGEWTVRLAGLTSMAVPGTACARDMGVRSASAALRDPHSSPCESERAL